jgi:uncharacterized repeat protein (TIGR02543 family)
MDPYQSFQVPGNIGNLAKLGYQWVGWATAPNAAVSDVDVGGFVYGFDFFDDAVFYAVWQAVGSVVVYDGNGSSGGSVPIDSSSPYSSGALVTVLGNTGGLVRSGYRFLGWNTSSSATTAQYVAGNTFNISSNTTLYALWKQIFTVTYNGNGSTGGSVPTDNSSPYDTGSTVAVLGNTGSLTKTNCTFLGWNTSQANANNGTVQYTQGSTFTIAQNTVLYAVWQTASSQTFTVVYNGNGSTSGFVPSDASSPYLFGASVVVLGKNTLVRTGYAFLGWNTNQANANNGNVQYTQGQTFNISANTTLYAVWIVTLTLTYNGNGSTSGTAPTDSSSPYNNGSTVTVLGQGTLLKTDYTFKGWNTNQTQANNGTVQYTQNQTFTITANTTLYAVWQQNVTPTFNVTYNANWPNNTVGFGTVPSDILNPYRAGDPVTVLANTGHLFKSGYAFLGWAYSSTAVEPDYKVNGPFVLLGTFNMPSNHVTLHAVWQTTSNSGHKVTYDINRPAGASGTGNTPTDNTNYAHQATVAVQGVPSNLLQSATISWDGPT